MRRHGVGMVLGVRYRFAARPPALAAGDPRSPADDPRYADVAPDDLPRGESHADTLARLTPYWNERIAPEIARGGRILIVSHKNTLRALAMLLERRGVPEMRKIRVPTGVPLVFVLGPGVDGRWQRVRAG